MKSYIILVFFGVISSNALSVVTEGRNQNVTSLEEPTDSKTDVFRQLLNQETLIRISLVKNVHSLMNDMVDMKELMSTNNKRLRDAEKEITSIKNEAKQEVASLKSEVQSLKAENQKLKDQVVRFQEEFKTNDNRFDEIDRKFGNTTLSRTRFERKVNERLEDFERNSSTTLNDIKVEVRYLSLTLFDLNKHSVELNMSLSNAMEDKFVVYADFVNKTVSEMKQRLITSEDYKEKVMHNLTTLGRDQTGLMKMISDNLTNTITSIKADVDQSQKTQLKLSAAVSSLEVFRMNMSLTNDCAVKTSIGFTVGMTSTSSSWSGDILVYSHVVSNLGNGYNPSTGKFTAPRDGTYVFFITIKTSGTNYIRLDIVLNGLRKVRAQPHNSASSMTGTNMAVFQLVRGDSVWVSRYNGQSYYSQDVPITTFSGFLL